MSEVKLKFEPSDIRSQGDYAKCSLGVFHIIPMADGTFAVTDHRGRSLGPFAHYIDAVDAANGVHRRALLGEAEKALAASEGREPKALPFNIFYDPQPTLPGRLPDELPYKLHCGRAKVGAFMNRQDAELFRDQVLPALGTMAKVPDPDQDRILSDGFPDGWHVQDRPSEHTALLCAPSEMFGAQCVCLKPGAISTDNWLATAREIAHSMVRKEN